jgi:glutamate-ammonia-ligase adenylyltransferase
VVTGGEIAILAMGRLGSREMTLASDLDLILIYDAPAASEESEGPRPLSLSAYYARLAQRLIGAITAPTAEGRLYEVDMRLRPTGSSGPIATSLDSFALYQRQSAWTWEHMALTRARPVAGSPDLQLRLEHAIEAALTMPRDPAKLVADVAEMRQRIAREHPHPAAWDLRNRVGGLVDLEFIVQYLMLRQAARTPAVLRRDIGAALAALGEAEALPPQAAQALGDTLTLLRNVRMLLTLLFEGPPAAEALAGPVGATLANCAGAIDFDRLDADITAACTAVGEWYERLVAEPARAAVKPKESKQGGVAK